MAVPKAAQTASQPAPLPALLLFYKVPKVLPGAPLRARQAVSKAAAASPPAT